MPQIQIAEKLLPLITRPKRIKIAVGGRGGSKSIAFADAFVKFCEDGERLCCAREFQNSIDDSVHSLIKSRAEHLGANCRFSATNITSARGGEIFYKGLSRNPESIKSMYGVKRIWVEEAQTLSEKTLDMLAPTIREGDSELWFSLNRGSSKDAFAQKYLKPYEKEVMRRGFYEDEDIIIIQINWWENPFFPEVLNKERLRDKDLLSAAKYAHIWDGRYSDTVENAIIEPDWFDACVDAHVKLGFEALGQEKVSFDPADTGDAKAVAYMHGSIVKDIKQTQSGVVDTATDWATSFTNNIRPDVFTWDCDGIGAGLKRQIMDAFKGKKIHVEPFKGSEGADSPDSVYQPLDGEVEKPKTNKQTFKNKRAQYYWELRDRMFKTWQAVVKGKYFSPDELISISSQIEDIDLLRSEVCSVPRKYVASGRIQLMTKQEMKRMEIDSPNMADALMMLMRPVDLYEADDEELDIPDVGWMAG